MKRLFSAIFIGFIILAGCKQENIEKAKGALNMDESRPDIQVSVLFDNSKSYKEYVGSTLDNVKKIFQYLASKYSDDERIKVSLILIDTNASIIFNGKAKDLQRPYDDVAHRLKDGQSRFTNLSDAVNKAIYFLREGKAKRKIMILFTDMKASTPDYYPKDEVVVPPPKDFPWKELKTEQIETYAFFVPYKEWQLWMPLVKENGVSIKAKLPEEMKTETAFKLIFTEEE